MLSMAPDLTVPAAAAAASAAAAPRSRDVETQSASSSVLWRSGLGAVHAAGLLAAVSAVALLFAALGGSTGTGADSTVVGLLRGAVGGVGGGDGGAVGSTEAVGRRLQLLTHDAGDADGPRTITFYVYRSQDDSEYSLENVNVADLPGVMWYLHNEVIGSAPRKFFITRILRYKITMRSDDRLYESKHSHFGPFVAFDSGRCTVPDCDSMWKTYGFNMGCQPLNTSRVTYISPFVTHHGGRDCAPNCYGALWYSLPGACPSMEFEGKTAECRAEMPGGQCNDPVLLGRPGVQCTYFVENAGEVRLDELVGIEDYTHWWAVEGNREYVWHLDHGIGTDFWDGRTDKSKNDERMNKVQEMFRRKYPDMPITYGEPPCDYA
mmetsp:Transcript_139816/g.446088  ORF Transcript_139816/g.446088 Transcript_139816/m.446088 type:complete len:378 (+) Transcript_139816:64-1197(+)